MIHPNSILPGFISKDIHDIMLKDTDLNLVNKVIQVFEYILANNNPAATDYFDQSNEIQYGPCGVRQWSYYLIDGVDILLIRRGGWNITLYTRVEKVIYNDEEENVKAYIYRSHSINVADHVRVHPVDVEYSELFTYLNSVKDNLIEGLNNRAILKLGGVTYHADFTFLDSAYSPYDEEFWNGLGELSKSIDACEELFNLYSDQYLKHSIPRIISKLKVGQKLPSKGEPLYKIKSVQDDKIELSMVKSRTNPKRAVVIGPEDLLNYYLRHLPVEWVEKAQ